MNTACCGVCVSQASFIEEYRELYACILSYDEKTLTGTAVGFDELGKLESIYYKTPVDEICDYKEIHDSIKGKNYDLVLSHYPIFSWKGMNRGTILLYGHTHDSGEDEYYQKCLAQMRENACYHYDSGKPIQAINVGCMKPYINYTPRSLEEILTVQ